MPLLARSTAPARAARQLASRVCPYGNQAQLTVLGVPGGMVRRSRAAGNALLVQQALRLGWGDQARRREAAAGYYRFVTDHVVAPDGTVLDQRADQQAVRPYNFPWFARFLLEAGDTYLAWRVMTRFTLLEVSTSGGSARVSCLAL